MALKLIKLWFFRKKTARQAWEQARDRYLDAKRRGDTRAMHDAWEPLKKATAHKLSVGA